VSDAKQLGGLSVDWELANDEARRWAQRYAGELVRGITDTTRATIQREVANFARNQESITQLSQRLAASSAFSQERARLIAVTEVTRSYSEGNQAAWRESNVVEGKMWITSVDERVCPICGPLHGVVVPLTAQFDGGFDGPPAHPRCRCDIAPAEIIDAGDTMAEYVEGGGFVERQPAEARTELERERFRDFNGKTKRGAQEINDWSRDSSYSGWTAGLTDEEKGWLTEYKLDGYEWINSALRGDESLIEMHGWTNTDYQKAKNIIDRSLKQHRLPNDITVWRGGGHPALTQALQNGHEMDDLVGMVIGDDAYISTSMNRGSADDFYKMAGKDAFKFEYQLPRGTYGAYIENINDIGEFEFLLPRETKFEILDAGKRGNVRHIIARVIEQ